MKQWTTHAFTFQAVGGGWKLAFDAVEHPVHIADPTEAVDSVGAHTTVRGAPRAATHFGLASSLSGGTYNGAAAAFHAYQFAYSADPNYRNWLPNEDCSNFVSQALAAGGWQYRQNGYWDWFYYATGQSLSWINDVRRADRSEMALASPTSWWHPELVQVARTVAEADDRSWAESLMVAAAHSVARAPRVQLRRDGSVVVDGVARPQDIWREGRTGSGVLRRYFQLLLERRERGWQRDELADALWPESEGDRAIRNLHAATYDLRGVLAEIPGARMSVADGTYELRLAASVSIE